MTTIDNEHIAKVWDSVSKVLPTESKDSSNPFATTSLFFDFVGHIEKSSRVLEVGCATGKSTRNLVERFNLNKVGEKASVCGVDLSTGMIEAAKAFEKQNPYGISYFASDAADMSVFKDGEFDHVVSIMALMDMTNLKGIFSEIYRVLSIGGKLSYSTRHPCFITPGTQILRGNLPSQFHLVVGGYFKEGGYLEKTMLGGKEFTIPRPSQTLSGYINAMIEAGFKITKIAEPRLGAGPEHANSQMSVWNNDAALRLFVEATK